MMQVGDWVFSSTNTSSGWGCVVNLTEQESRTSLSRPKRKKQTRGEQHKMYLQGNIQS